MKKSLAPLTLLAIWFLAAAGPAANVDHYVYNVSLDGKSIGTYEVNRTDIGESSTFRVETITEAGLIRPMRHKFVMLSAYNGNSLISSDLKSWVNDELESSTLLQWDGSQYVKQEGETLTEICCEQVNFSSATIFFNEPVNRTKMFYEKYGKELLIEKIGDHTYQVKLPNGGVERYKYENGKVSEVEFVQSFATIRLKKQG
jgi:hypothetical protein